MLRKAFGGRENGTWQIAPRNGCQSMRRGYHGETLVLETEFETSDGVAAVVDFMPIGSADDRTDLIRIVRGIRGTVELRSELILRFDYGKTIPWVTRHKSGILAMAAPHALLVQAPIAMKGDDVKTVADFTVSAGQVIPFTLMQFPSHKEEPEPVDPIKALTKTATWWTNWSARCSYDGPWREAVIRSLIVIKALCFSPSGGIVAAATTSLPEVLGGRKNWDYRFCWLRDATFTFYALKMCGYDQEAVAWREWLFRAVAGHPTQMRTVYGVGGERLLFESELTWLPGYEESVPVRIGNTAEQQFQMDVYGEIVDSLYVARKYGLPGSNESWPFEKRIADFLENSWKEPDNGIWEMRGSRRHFTHSKMMTWVALDRAIKIVDQFGASGPADRWRNVRDSIHRDVCERGFNTKRNAFVQDYGSEALDASLLLMPLVGFLPPDDPRVTATVEAIARELSFGGLIFRYADHGTDRRPASEGAFLPCTFWLADALILMGKKGEALKLFERVLSLRNATGLLSEEYDPGQSRLLGNFPQTLSHVCLINAAYNLTHAEGPAAHRAKSR
jgi:GH15 family glucan-1,4-alpha-glucosidase